MTPSNEEYAAVCGILHNVFYRKPDPLQLAEVAHPGLLESWPKIDPQQAEALQQVIVSLQQDTPDTLRRDFYALFVGPGGMHAYPWGSVYTDRESLLCGDTTHALSRFCRQQGLLLELPHREPIDHLGLILGMLNQLLQQQRQPAAATLLSHHLLPWADRVIEAVLTHASTGYFRGFAQLLQQLLNHLRQHWQLQPLSLPLYR
ncbi:TorD/DmsD family molecular chaperone [Ferrimonas marina]|uniref:Chaperone TorD involved in molybdoenzyme TorA maturation n=1 Tax=Ferrimonas marina TaxID=299255 RepID=A0A1M5XV86_9GAMM|nr:molecular chaperone TorD family protein [Ferrimonas marina]SHI03448.1 chaperone TorD involved in molybdoenzyme TorA maturation [Ferrimonas marina]